MPRKYDLEFKLEAVRLAAEPGVTNRDVERRLGIGQGVLSRWKKELKRDGAQAFPGKVIEMPKIAKDVNKPDHNPKKQFIDDANSTEKCT